MVIVWGRVIVVVEDDFYLILVDVVVIFGENLFLVFSLVDLYSYSGEFGYEDREIFS